MDVKTQIGDDPKEKSFLEQVGAKIRETREQKAISRKALSDLSGVSQRYLAQMESGAGNVSILLLHKVAVALGRTPSSLLSQEKYSPAELGFMDLFKSAPPDRQRDAMNLLAAGSSAKSPGSTICLIGLRGAGKTTLGRLLAEKLDYEFIELNSLIERQSGIPVSEVMALYGQEGYRQLERRALQGIVAADRPAVLAVGGGIVSEPETFSLLLRSFHTIWLRASPEEHMERVRKQGDQRPMAGNPKAMEELRSILTSRESLYSQADATVDTGGKSIDQSLIELMTACEEMEAV